MHTAQITAWGQSPQYVLVPDLAAPGPDELRIKVKAAGVHQVVRSRASGKHYLSKTLPHVPGIDGVGTTEDGQLVYFASMEIGTMAEHINVAKKAVRVLPEGVDPVQIAGLVNPAMSSWMALKARTTDLPKDFTVLILGATSSSGRVAIPLARALGAKRVIGAARNNAVLETLGLDQSVVIAEEADKTDFSTLGDVDVVLDYVFGPLAVHLFTSFKQSVPMQYVHIGSLSAMDINLPGAVLRSKNLTIRGAGPGSWTMREFGETAGELLAAMKDVPVQPVREAKLADVEKEWNSKGDGRLVFVTE